jgi:hypothetical protein
MASAAATIWQMPTSSSVWLVLSRVQRHDGAEEGGWKADLVEHFCGAVVAQIGIVVDQVELGNEILP